MVLTKLVFILKHKEIDILKANEVERWMNCGLNFNLCIMFVRARESLNDWLRFFLRILWITKASKKEKKYSSRLENRIQIRLEGLEALSTCPSPFPGRPQGACVTSHEETAGRSFPIHVYLLLLSLFSFSLIIFLFSLSLIFALSFVSCSNISSLFFLYAMLTQSNVSLFFLNVILLSLEQ